MAVAKERWSSWLFRPPGKRTHSLVVRQPVASLPQKSGDSTKLSPPRPARLVFFERVRMMLVLSRW
jgi:hypothetical protein